ncbi:MAG TPA: PfkB family carbohydrate kinase [Candidatus Deferrimicrobium sp.]|nr:PfkB family carbohydrate kinase [Candidatus Deferrimicrobium sp.]
MPSPPTASSRPPSSAGTAERSAVAIELTVSDRPRVCVVGSLHFDIMVQAPYLPRTGETLIGDAWWWKQGGKGANQAVAAARHGAAVQMIGCLGDDEFGARLRERLEVSGVDLAHVLTVAQGSGMSVAIQEGGGDYAAIVVSGANRQLDDERIAESSAIIEGSRVLLLQNEVAEAANVSAARLARRAGAMVVLNAAPARPLGGLAGLVDVLVVNAVEAEMLGGGSVDDLASAARAARTLLALAPAVVVTAGGAGVAAASGQGGVSVEAHPVPRVETHAAGDVFVGALGARLAHAEPLAEALRYANAAAALHVGTPEAERDALGPADVQRLFEAPGLGVDR